MGPAIEPGMKGEGAESCSLVDHNLKRVGELELAPGAELPCDQLVDTGEQQGRISDHVDAADRQIRDEFLRLLQQ